MRHIYSLSALLALSLLSAACVPPPSLAFVGALEPGRCGEAMARGDSPCSRALMMR